MRFSHYTIFAVLAAAILAVTVAAGCRTSPYSGLPRHIRTVEVPIFQNKTMNKSIEAWITRDIIDAVNADPRIRVASYDGDAVISGEILAVNRHILRETVVNEPGTVQISVTVRFSFFDKSERRYIIENMTLTSSDYGMSGGLYEASRDESPEQGERGAVKQLAGEIVRRTVAMW